MDAVTYPNEKVISFIKTNVIPLRIPSDHQSLSNKYGVSWTPALFLLDQNGHEHQATIGFFNPDDLIPSLLPGIGNMHFHQDYFTQSINFYSTILSEYDRSDAAPEAIFQRGVALYKSTGDPKPLKKAYEQLTRDFPENTWTKRAYPYRFLP